MPHRAHWAGSGDVFDLRVGVATGVQWVEDHSAATHPAMHMSVPTTKNQPIQSVSGAGIEKPCFRASPVLC